MALKSGGARVLVVDDNEIERQAMLDMVSSMGYIAEAAGDGEEALEKLGSASFDVIVTDLMMPRMDGFQLLRTMLDRGDPTPAIVLTGFGSMDHAVSIVHDLRAFWFLEKPALTSALATLLERAIQHKNLLNQTARLQRQLSNQGVLGDLVGGSAAMREVFSLIQQAAPTTASVLITGESGTGKERVAAAIHGLSPRASGPFVAVNCAALPETLIESELFGHEKGSYTGAFARHAGCFEQAHQGTLLLDEIGEMPLAMQTRLLRVLEDSKIRRLGGNMEISVDVRILAATNRPTRESLDQKTLREDLYYRLNVFHIHLPPLRHRKEDIPALADAILHDVNRKNDCRISELHPATLERLVNYNWPGNIRELRNVLERAAILAKEGVLRVEHLPGTFGIVVHPAQQVSSARPAAAGINLEAGKPLNELEKAYIRLTLQSTNNNKKRAAEILGISLRTLHNRLAAFAEEERKTGVAEASAAGSGPG